IVLADDLAQLHHHDALTFVDDEQRIQRGIADQQNNDQRYDLLAVHQFRPLLRRLFELALLPESDVIDVVLSLSVMDEKPLSVCSVSCRAGLLRALSRMPGNGRYIIGPLSPFSVKTRRAVPNT